ncbi:hypothetical protein [Scytonema sp. PRP1]|uniref:hypothetical protein n=1 Tax=Scytonema sp. PRP1 TaxID=3120513 RepID=UPI00300C8292
MQFHPYKPFDQNKAQKEVWEKLMSGLDFTRVDGLGVLTVQIILSEVGLDQASIPYS